jgi:hypothetical protein
MAGDIIRKCRAYSMISTERFMNNINAVSHVENKNVDGDVVEIGVWKGGSILSMIMKYEEYGKKDRTFHLYDTFEGMTEPTAVDRDIHNSDAKALLVTRPFIRCISSLEEVKSNIAKNTKYPNIEYHVGDICKNTYYPEKIAILRLDTDWYESTKFELDNFYNLVTEGGVVIIDDYGHWKGCRKAVDEFLLVHPEIKLIPVDYTGVYFIKPKKDDIPDA